MTMFEKFYSFDMTTNSLLQESRAVAANFSSVILYDGVGSVVSYNVVDTIA
jgi:hypothetical protein